MIQHTDAPQDNQPNRYGWRWISGALLLLTILAALLAADLAFRGLAWQFFWSQTGEESALGQLRGMVEVTGNLIRSQPETAPLAPIDHADDIPFGINTFLQLEADPAKREEQLRMIRAAGFRWIRQEFTWEDIEVDGRGQFTDTRNDMDGDGELDEISGWAKYDNIVDLADEYGIGITARLSNPPDWSRSDPNIGDQAPPDDLQDFVNFARAVAERYEGRITHYQIWNEPNIYPEWGEQFVDPARYTEMLCRVYDALKAVDPQITVISAAIAPTKSLDGYIGYQDLVFLQNIYDNGAADCFDVLSAQGYGLFSGPTDRRLRATDVNVQRHVYYRDIMVANGDAHKPIWLSELAWNPVLSAERPRDQIADFSRFGTVTDEQNARYVPLAYQRAREEWSWIGHVSYWFFTRPDDSEVGQSFYYFRMAEPDYSPDKPTFTPLPVYETMSDYIAAVTDDPLLYRGTHQSESWEVTAPDSELVTAEGAEFSEALQANEISFATEGTSVSVRVLADSAVTVQRAGATIATIDPADEWQTVRLSEHLLPQRESYTLSGEALLLDSITVRNGLWRNIGVPLLVITLLTALGVLELARRALRRITR